tara:strand:- start:5935 stop:6777 length:843 start_codon:yes stop_codon:yes gene_type:complete
MGIKNLFKILDLNQVNLSDIKKYKTIAVDISCWLHKVKYVDSCALALNKNHDGWKIAFINIFKPLCENHKLIFVFDGETPKIKQKEHERRRTDNIIIKKIGYELLKNHETKYRGMNMLLKLVEVKTLIPEVKKIIESLNSEWVQSEYEADQKLAQMSLSNQIDLIMTEDTDLIVYGCSKILYKYKNGKGELYDRSILFGDESNSGNRFFENWELFQRYCILSGCDYYSKKGISFRSAMKICKTDKTYKYWENSQDNNEIEKINNVLHVFIKVDPEYKLLN